MSAELLERIWESTGNALNGVIGGLEKGLTSLFGSSNARQVKRLQGIVTQINELEPSLQAMSEAELADQTVKFRRRLRDGETLDDILVEAFATCREAGRRYLNMRHYDVQLIGGMVLHGGNIAEMITGEGKTLVATLPAYLNALAGPVHVITVNDYLARRDMEWMAPLFMGLGLTVGNIQSGIDNDARQKAYACDITYGTNNEFGFDYLRDNMRIAARGDGRFPLHTQQVQGPLVFAIIDEVDNILIDEARTPLIISGSAHQDANKYREANQVARSLKAEEHFVVNEKDRHVTLTDEGVREAEKLAGVESFYTAGNMEWPHLIDNALRALYLYRRDVNYVVKDGAIVIVDEFTGRLMEGRQWSDGLHQAVETKEGVKIKDETQTLATITLQNFFKLYKKLSGMTGTAMTEASEFVKIYGLDVVAIPTNKVLERLEHPDVIFLKEEEKFAAVADSIERTMKWDVVEVKGGSEYWGTIKEETDDAVTLVPKGSKETETISRSEILNIGYKGRPVLVGTVSIEKSEAVSRLLEQRGIKHQILNAKNHGREAEIIAQAGRMGAVTIATNMAGRGTDIILGGNPETMAWAQLQHKYPTRLEVPKEEWDSLVEEIEKAENMRVEGEKVRDIGGLYVIGTERHESRRIDLQLRGRCGRQGDPGGSRFFLSLEDDLMRIFAGDWVRNVMGRLGMGEGEPIESSFVSRRISAAQKKVEERNFEIRKNLLEYDEVMDFQRKKVYTYRQRILDGVSCKTLVLEQIQRQMERAVEEYLDPMFGPESYANWAGSRLACELEAKDFRSTDAETAEFYARDFAERAAETQIVDAIDENLPETEEESEWNWEALAKWSNSLYGTNFRGLDLKKSGRDRVDELLVEKSHAFISGVDLSEAKDFLAEDFGLKMLVDWMKNKFGIEVEPSRLEGKEPKIVKQVLLEEAEKAYKRRETHFPVIAGMTRYQTRVTQNSVAIDRDSLVQWASRRFGDDSLLQLEETSGEKIYQRLVEASEQQESDVELAFAESKEKIASLYSHGSDDQMVRHVSDGNGSMQSLVDWLSSFDDTASKERIESLDRQGLENFVSQAIDEKYFPEIRRMERQVILQIVDSAWKDHLLAMDHLRSAISLKSYAQMDPKVEYKREGMRLFDKMWLSIGEQVTNVIFRMEGLSEGFVGNTLRESDTIARHDSAESTSDLVRKQSGENSQSGASESDPVTIRNRNERIGRNDTCPCGSGKKYKNCCMRKTA